MSADGWLPGFEPPPIPPETSCCADCGIDTLTIGEWYMVDDDLWDGVWLGRRKSSWHAGHGNYVFISGQEILCIGCLEARLGRTLCAQDFTDAPINELDELDKHTSERMRHRLTATTTRALSGRNP